MKSLITCAAIGSLLLAGSTALAASAAGTGAKPMQATHAPTTTATTTATTTTTTTHVAPTVRGPTTTGQPNQSCGSVTAPNTPGNAATASGSAFNPGGTAGTVYAGEQPQNT